VTWLAVEIDGETAGVGREGRLGEQVLTTDRFAEDLETVKVIHATAGDFSCKHCGERWNDETDDIEEGSRELCEDNVCEDPKCECTEHTHELESAPMSWFEEAAVRIDHEQEEVSVSIKVNGKRFVISAWYAENIDGGSLMVRVPGTSGTRPVDPDDPHNVARIVAD